MKKSILTLLIALNIILLFAFPGQAQHQRLGVAPQSRIFLNSVKPSEQVEAFCLDRHKVIDGTYDYSYVLASDSKTVVTVGNRKLTLQKAIDKGLIKVESLVNPDRARFGSAIGVKFTSLTELPVTIEIRDALALGENPGSFKSQAALGALKNPRSYLSGESKAIQDRIWEADIDRTRLEAVGYNSVEEFQIATNLPRRGLDAATRAKLEEVEAALIARFEAVGLYTRRTDTRVQSVADGIINLQQAIGAKTIGVFGPDIRARLERYERVDFPVVKELREYNTGSRESLFLRLKSSMGDPNLYTLYSHGGILYEGNNVAQLRLAMSRLARVYNKVYVDLDFPSKTKADAFKTSYEIAGSTKVRLIEADAGPKDVIFSIDRTFEVSKVTNPVLRSGEYSSTVDLKSTNAGEVHKSWKLRATSRIKESVTQFTGAFRRLIGRKEKQSLATIIERARAADEAMNRPLDVRVSFIDEFGEIQLGKIFFGNYIQVDAE